MEVREACSLHLGKREKKTACSFRFLNIHHLSLRYFKTLAQVTPQEIFPFTCSAIYPCVFCVSYWLFRAFGCRYVGLLAPGLWCSKLQKNTNLKISTTMFLSLYYDPVRKLIHRPCCERFYVWTHTKTIKVDRGKMCFWFKVELFLRLWQNLFLTDSMSIYVLKLLTSP